MTAPRVGPLGVLSATGAMLYRDSNGDVAELPAGSNGQVVTLAGGIPTWAAPGGGGSGAVCFDVNQVAHGLAVSEPIYVTSPGGVYTKAQADVASTLALGVVTDVADVDNFSVCQAGKYTDNAHGLTVGETYYVDADTAGAITTTEPPIGFSQPILLVLDANDLLVTPYRPSPM